MKKTCLILLFSAATLSGYSQRHTQASGAVPQSASINTPAHYPRVSTEGNLKKWVASYPKEAEKYRDALLTQLQSKNPSADTKQYDATKSEYTTINRMITQAAAQKASPNPAKQ